jgi:hypothetical protein
MRDRHLEFNRFLFAMTPARDHRRGGSRACGTRPLFRQPIRSRTLQSHPRHASND